MKEILEKYFGEVKISSKGEYRINSPYFDDNNFHLYINQQKQKWFDFHEQIGGDLKSFFKKHLIPNKLKKQKIKIEKEEEIEIPKFLLLKNNKNNEAYRYLKKRKVPEKNIEKLGFCIDGVYKDRIFIPFFEENEIIYFVTRDFTNSSKLRYLNPKGKRSDKVYNIDKINKNESLFIFEGIFDSIMLENQIGTAILTNSISDQQIEKITQKNPKKIIFVPDNDKIGRKKLFYNVKKFKQFEKEIDFFVFDDFEGKDFSESGENFIDEKKCRPFDELKEKLYFIKKFL